jgi:hypothetical protein
MELVYYWYGHYFSLLLKIAMATGARVKYFFLLEDENVYIRRNIIRADSFLRQFDTVQIEYTKTVILSDDLRLFKSSSCFY